MFAPKGGEFNDIRAFAVASQGRLIPLAVPPNIEQFMLARDELEGKCPEPTIAPPPPIAPAMTPAGANDAVYSVPTPSAREARPQRDDADDEPPEPDVNPEHGKFIEPKKFRMSQVGLGHFMTVLVLRIVEKILRTTGIKGVKHHLKQELEYYVTGPHVATASATQPKGRLVSKLSLELRLMGALLWPPRKTT